MRILLSAVFLILSVLPVTSFAKKYEPVTISVDELPADVESFLALRSELSGTPEGGAVIMLLSLMKFVEDPDMGRKFMVIAMDRSNLRSGDDYKGLSPANALNYHLNRFSIPERKHIPSAYIVGATPQNEYTVPKPWKFELTRNKHSEQNKGMIKVFMACYGTSWPRPITLKKNDKGIWKAYEFSSLFLDVVGPASMTEIDDDI